jgi:NADPH-dependent 2,4-dienoyl-CoA reductase/sulfur reductase-like enzyme
MTENGRHVVIAGGSFAGLGAAYTLRNRLHPNDRVTVVSPSDQFVFAPSLVWAALGRPLVQSTFALEPALKAKGIGFVRSPVWSVRPADRTVQTDGGHLTYDRLVIATGGHPDSVTIPGLAGESRAASWVVGEDSATEARTVLRRLTDSPGPLVVGAAQGASYISGAYELALALHLALRYDGIREQVPMTFVTVEPYLGELGFGQSAAREKLELLFQERGIATHTGVWIDRIQPGSVTLSTGKTLEAAAAIIMPPFTGSLDIWQSAKLTSEDGLIAVDDHYRHVHFPDIYAVGVASHFSQPVAPLGSARPPHTGYLSLHMGRIAGVNVAASLDCGLPAERPLPERLDIRILDGGDAGLLLTSQGKTRLHHNARRLPGSLAHYLKSAVERYLIWRLRTGRMNLP